MIGFVYLWMDSGRHSVGRPNRRMFCLGSHRGSEDDGYITGTGGRHFKAAYLKRPQDFKRRVIQRIYEGTGRTVYEAEQRWLDLIEPEELSNGTLKRYYNTKKAALGMSREDMLRLHAADPSLGPRRGKASRDAYAANPAMGQRLSESYYEAISADPTLPKRRGQTNRDANIADPTRGERMSKRRKEVHAADPTIAQRQGNTYRETYARDPTLGPRLSQSKRDAHAADPTIAQRQSATIKETFARKTAEEKRAAADKSWETRRANGTDWSQMTPEQWKARGEKMWATRRANAAAKKAAADLFTPPPD